MFCPNCGFGNNDGANNCSNCGVAFQIKKKSGKGLNVIIAMLSLVVIALIAFAVYLFIQKGVFSNKNTEVTNVQQDVDASLQIENNGEKISVLARPMLLSVDDLSEENVVPTPNTPALRPEKGLINVINKDQFFEYGDNEENMKRLERDGFYIRESGSYEFFETYEYNRYVYTPNFVTVDSLMHTYHLYFQNLLKNTEKKYLSAALSELSKDMLDLSIDQCESLVGTEWEAAAKRNVAFFGVGAYLQDKSVQVPQYASETIKKELLLIKKAEGIALSPIFGVEEDYSQYIPRGYYEGDEEMEKYFRAMMWYGRRAFEQKDEISNRSALLISIAMQEGSYDNWEKIYSVTSFFAGEKDDLGYCEYMPIIDSVYGKKLSLNNLINNKDAFAKYTELIQKLNPPMINSVVVHEGESNVTKSFRFMSQRFTVDTAIMQQLVYQNVKENARGEKRLLPDTLDTAAVLGSNEAYEILKNQGDTDYENYEENLSKMKQIYQSAPAKVWNSSLYSSWLNTLRPVLEEKGEGYPFFMQTKEWNKKEIETFAGSYAELKHDTILYSKQLMSEMGGGEIPEYDDRGYVEPQALVYFRFKVLSDKTRSGLENFGMLDSKDSKNLKLLTELADKLYTISCKELKNESLTDEEYELIRTYGGQLEHFWKDATIGLTGDEDTTIEAYPCPIIADIATDPNGSVLEAGTGMAQDIYVVVPVEGKLKIAVGTVYSFYQFAQPMNMRLTDSKWRQMLGCEVAEDGMYNWDEEPEQPEWTQSYRIKR